MNKTNVPAFEPLEARLLYSATKAAVFADEFESTAEITADGGTITGTATYGAAVFGNGVNLAEETAAVAFAPVGLPASGIIEFWIRPGSNAKSNKDGFFSAGDFGQPNSFGAYSRQAVTWENWVAKVQNVIEVKVVDSAGGARIARSGKFKMKSNQWQHVAIEWSSGNVRPKDDYLAVHVNGKKGSHAGNPFKGGFVFSAQTLAFGDIDADYRWNSSKEFDHLIVHDDILGLRTILADAKAMWKVVNH